MGLFSRIIGLGVATGAAVGAYFVAKKYQENSKTPIITIENEQDGTEEYIAFKEKDMVQDVKKAAKDVYVDAKTAVKSSAEKIGIDTVEFTDAMGSAGKAIADASKAVAKTVKENAPEVVQTVKDKAEKVVSKSKNKQYTSPDADEMIMIAQDLDISEPVQEDGSSEDIQ